MAEKGGIKNLKGFQTKLKKRMVDNPEKHVKDLVRKSTTLVEGTVIELLNQPGTGRTYQKYEPRRQHTASARGEPPAKDQGILVNSISISVREEKDAVVGRIIASADYAPYLEFGTSTIEKRPFMQPGLERNRPNIKRIFKKGGYID